MTLLDENIKIVCSLLAWIWIRIRIRPKAGSGSVFNVYGSETLV
jgi:hypothetical protein